MILGDTSWRTTPDDQPRDQPAPPTRPAAPRASLPNANAERRGTLPRPPVGPDRV